MKLEFVYRVYKNTQISYFMKIRQLRAEFVPRGQTVKHDKANSLFSQFYERVQERLEISRLFQAAVGRRSFLQDVTKFPCLL
jgi:hypothetical protein